MSHTSHDATLFEFSDGFQTWRFTSSKRDETYDSQTYQGKALRHGSANLLFSNDKTDLEAPDNVEPFSLFVTGNPIAPIECVIRRASDGVVIFRGDFTNIEFKSTADRNGVRWGKIQLNSISLRASTGVPWRRFGSGCWHNLFDSRCGVLTSGTSPISSTPFSKVVAVSGVTFSGGNRILQAAAFDVGSTGDHLPTWWRGGRVQWGNAQAMVQKHDGDQVWLHTALNGSGADLTIFAGCDKSKAACSEKFGNLERILAFYKTPGRNPVTEGVR